jgi:hypothetical protein
MRYQSQNHFGEKSVAAPSSFLSFLLFCCLFILGGEEEEDKMEWIQTHIYLSIYESMCGMNWVFPLEASLVLITALFFRLSKIAEGLKVAMEEYNLELYSIAHY